MPDKKQFLIPDSIWQKYLEEEYGNVQYCKPKKEEIEKYLTWYENHLKNLKMS